MLTLTRFKMTMVAPAAVVILLSACLQQGAPKAPNIQGSLIFQLNDTDSVAIPGCWYGDTLVLNNAEESLTLVPSDTSDNVWGVPVFDGSIVLVNNTGQWKDNLRSGDYQVPVQWKPRQTTQKSATDWSNDTLSWLLSFGEQNPWFGQLYLQRAGALCRGSIATPTGDFRYLHGSLDESGRMSLQTFDGAHLFYFKGHLSAQGDIVDGVFLSGNHYSTPFSGTRISASEAGLTEAPKAQWTGLPLAYSGLSLDGDSVHWTSEGAKGVHVLSVMGSWCPNCMDEHRLLLNLSAHHPDLTIHTLAFERGAENGQSNETALQRLSRYSEQMGMGNGNPNWRITLLGPASKTEAQKALPFLDRVVSFPTTVVYREGQDAPWIHSGFNGPAMGPAYEIEVAKFASAVSDPLESR